MEDAMGFFSDIKDKIFNRHQEPAPTTASTTTAAGSAPLGTPVSAGAAATPAPAPKADPAAQPTPTPAQSAPTASGTTAASSVDVAAILDQAVAQNGQDLKWRTSIVDLMKALGIDSSLTARKEMAAELHYTGDTNDSATMNIWLHKQVLQKLAANGGKVPADLLD